MLRSRLCLAGLVALAACGNPADSGTDAELGRVRITAPSSLFAKVDMAGNLVAGRGVTGVSRLHPGRYEVTFDRDMRSCAYVATTSNTYSQAIQAFVASGHVSDSGVYIETKNQGGGLTDGAFSLVAMCGGPYPQWAVVRPYGYVVRASHPIVRSEGAGEGVSFLRFADPLGNCAFIATIGDPGNGTVINTGYIAVMRMLTSPYMAVETADRNGNSVAFPHHVVILCPDPATMYAHVRADGRMSQGSPGVSSTVLPSGDYRVTFPVGVSQCAVVATRAEEWIPMPFSRATVEVNQTSRSPMVNVQVREILSAGGNLTAAGFHIAAVC